MVDWWFGWEDCRFCSLLFCLKESRILESCLPQISSLGMAKSLKVTLPMSFSWLKTKRKIRTVICCWLDTLKSTRKFVLRRTAPSQSTWRKRRNTAKIKWKTTAFNFSNNCKECTEWGSKSTQNAQSWDWALPFSISSVQKTRTKHTNNFQKQSKQTQHSNSNSSFTVLKK